jgi:exopolysaccharide biosynthesis protein
MHLHIVTVDLTDPHVHVVVRKAGEGPDAANQWETTLMRPSQIAERDHLALAVNGDFFMSKDVLKTGFRNVPYFVGNWANVCGWAMSDGEIWSMRPAPASLLVDEKGKVSVVRLGGRPAANVKQIVSGMSIVVEHGRNVGNANEAPAPHTVAGVSRDGGKLVLLVVDGRRPEYSAGMTMAQLGDEMIRFGCDAALQLDGGGSSSMTIYDPANTRYDVVNRPSDGHDFPIPISVERPVANVLGIRVDNIAEGKAAASAPATRPVK